YLYEDLHQYDIDQLIGIDLRMEAVGARDELIEVEWLSNDGLGMVSSNLDQAVNEYRTGRNLQSMRICILGPTAVGKTRLSRQMCAHYKLQYVEANATTAEKIKTLLEQISESELDVTTDDQQNAKEYLIALQ